VAGAVREAVGALSRRGCEVRRFRPSHLERGFELWADALAKSGGPKFHEVIADGGRFDLLHEWLRWPARRSAHTFPVLGLATLERLVAVVQTRAPEHAAKLAALREELRREVETTLGPNGVLVCPVFHRAAPRHGLHALFHFLGFTYSGTWNPLELPATAVPTGFDDGLPVGVQVVGARNRDTVTLSAAEWIEEDLGGWCPPWRAPLRQEARPTVRSTTPSR
jgi:Asp-tRNA(Asn)/Glu-tRNA(Gln) amidotransferase A subunit family amidase